MITDLHGTNTNKSGIWNRITLGSQDWKYPELVRHTGRQQGTRE
jgi:hypothetical protein